jgi:phytoene/squalene synthetase
VSTARPSDADAAFCAGEVRRHDPDRFLAALFAPSAVRERLLALYAFDGEIARIPGMVSEPILGDIRLQWWREALEAAMAGSPPAHPVIRSLLPAIREGVLPVTSLVALIDERGRQLDAEGNAARPSWEAFDNHQEESAGRLVSLAASLLLGGVRLDEAGEHAARAAGRVLGAVSAARMIAGGRGRGIACPVEAAASETQVAELRRHAGQGMEAVRQGWNAIPRGAIPAFLPVVLAELYILKGDVPLFRRQWRLFWAALAGRP